MKLLPLLILLSSFFCESNFAQNKKLDGFYKQLATTTDTRQRINISNNISAELKLINADSALSLSQKTLTLAEQENYPYGIGTAYLAIGLANSAKGRFELLNEYAQKAIAIADKIKSDSLMGYSLQAMGAYHFDKGNYDISIEKEIAAIHTFEKISDAAGILKAKTVMSQVYQLKNDLPRAQQILQENLLLFPKIDDAKIKINTLHTLANVYGMQGKYKEALALDSQGIKLCDIENTAFYKSSFYDNMANCYMYSNRFTEAEKYFRLCLQLDSSFDNKKQQADTYLNLGTLMLMQKKYPEARSYLTTAVSLSNTTGYKQGAYGAYLTLSDVYKAQNETEKAFDAISKATALKDSLINEKTENKIVELETLYQTEKKEQQLQLQKAEITKKNYLLWGLALSIGLLVLAGFAFYRKRVIQQELRLQSEVIKQQDIATRAIINAEENERKRIAADLHDGVGQMMSAAKMNLSAFEHEMTFKDETQKLNFEKLLGLVDESCKEIRNVSHQMMPNALLKSSLASAVKEFLDKIDNRIIKINLHAEGLQERLDSNTETVLYRVIQECVNNVIKHSGANKLDISLIKDVDGISATVEDNGRGFDTADKKKFEGIGLKNISSRVTFLKGTVDFDSAPGRGTLVAIHVPFDR